MIDELKNAAEKLRTKVAQPFYSMREVAAFFRAPLSTIPAVYQALENEGILSRIRGSRTMLLGKTTAARESSRGVVGYPIWLRSIAILPFTQTFVVELQERLQEFGFRADLIFHWRKEDEVSPDFALRLLRHRLDAVILFSPLAGVIQNLQSLRERGVRVLVIRGFGQSVNLPAIVYAQDLTRAFSEMAVRWRNAGISRVWVWRDQPGSEKNFVSAFRAHNFKIEIVDFSPREMLKAIGRIKVKSRLGVVFTDTVRAEVICNSEPEIIERICQVSRMGLLYGRIRSPYHQARKVLFDIVEQDPLEMAARLALDISRLSVLPDGFCHTFYARYIEQGILGDALP